MTDEDAVIPTRDTLDIIDSDDSSSDNSFYGSTTYNKGLLTNVATGGWRKDLSLFSEYFDELPQSNLPLFSAVPGESLQFNREGGRRTTTRATNGLLYFWKDYLGTSTQNNWQQTPPICSWTALTNYMKKYEDLTSRSAANVTMDAFSGGVGGSGARVDFQEEIRVNPQVARVQWVISLGATNSGAEYNPGIVVAPIVTLWNPYNVAISVDNYFLNFDEVFPLRISYQVSRASYRNIPLSRIIENRIRANFPDTIELGPGENKVFGVAGSTPVENSGRQNIELEEGYEPNGGVIFTNINIIPSQDANTDKEIVGSANTSFAITNVDFAATGLEGVGGDDGIGIRLQAHSDLNNDDTNIIVMSYNADDFGGSDVIDAIYPPITTNKSTTLSSVVGSQNEVFAVATLGLRMVSPAPADSRFANIRTKGMLQSNPLQSYAEVGAANDGNAIENLALSGAYHTVNAPYDFVISEADSWNDSLVAVDFERRSGRGFLLTGTKTADGLNRVVLAELPTAPLQSLADLQHFDARNNNQMPPFQFNIIGNSSAHPLFGPEQTAIETRGAFEGLSNDDSYLLNHVLFDDWFMSSIGPKLRAFTSREETPIEEVFTQFLDEEDTLPNWFYTPSILAKDLPSDEQEDLYLSGDADSDTGLFPFETIASLLEVEGMFNINSVSTDAWSAVLRRNRDLDVPYFSSSDGVVTEETTEPAFPRTTVAGDVDTNSSSVITDNNIAAQAGGYVAFTDEQIDALAEEIVDQVRKRGPFLSLAEFVNRRLSSDTDLALAGTIQRALDMMAERSGDENPFKALQDAGEEITSAPPGITDYKFPEAALGSTNFGVPGWVRQADILRSLAPIMSARDDTFTIRAYGDSRDASGTIVAQAWCEVVVQREAEFIDTADNPQLNPHSSEITSESNQRFGRRYKQVSFRWLKESEV